MKLLSARFLVFWLCGNGRLAAQAVTGSSSRERLRDRLGQDLFGENTLSFAGMTPPPVKQRQEFTSEFFFKPAMLPNGEYAVKASVTDGDLYNNVQHNWLRDAHIINMSSSKIRSGLVGIAFERVVLEARNDQ